MKQMFAQPISLGLEEVSRFRSLSVKIRIIPGKVRNLTRNFHSLVIPVHAAGGETNRAQVRLSRHHLKHSRIKGLKVVRLGFVVWMILEKSIHQLGVELHQ